MCQKAYPPRTGKQVDGALSDPLLSLALVSLAPVALVRLAALLIVGVQSLIVEAALFCSSATCFAKAPVSTPPEASRVLIVISSVPRKSGLLGDRFTAWWIWRMSLASFSPSTGPPEVELVEGDQVVEHSQQVPMLDRHRVLHRQP